MARMKANACKKQSKVNVWGGSAAGGGMNFQACVSALATVHLARGTPIGWLNGVANDIPISLSAETGGSGDDIRLEFHDGSVAEIQAKRGIKIGRKFWKSLLDLAIAVNSETISYGILAVCPNSSGTIRDGLAKDIKRLGQGRQDSLKPPGQNLKKLLVAKSLDVERVCGKLRIVTVHALDSDSASVSAARAELAHLCTDIQGAWDRIYSDAHSLIELRGRRTAVTTLQILRSAGIELRVGATDSPVGLLQKLSTWVVDTTDQFAVLGIAEPLPLDSSWIKVKAIVQEEDQSSDNDLAQALARYHSWDSRSSSRNAKQVDSETLGQFVRRCVVVAGPGMGKTTLLKRLARIYAKAGHPVLRVRLPTIAARIKISGQGFEEGVLDLGLDGSGLIAKDLRRAGLQNVVLLCDGLDECGPLQIEVAQGLLNFTAGHPHCRIITTTRPIGYDTSLLRSWRHYELLPLDYYDAKQNLSKLLKGVLAEGSQAFKSTLAFAEVQLDLTHVKTVAARSPMLLGFLAALALKSVSAGATRTYLYRQLFKLIEDAPNSRPVDRDPGSILMVRFLEILGWNLLAHPYESLLDTLNRCAKDIAPELGQSLTLAQDTCQRCARRWEDLGMLERVRYQADEAITFIHKTFGEYAAARQLANLDSVQQNATLRSHITDGAWAETIKFACSMGLAEEAINATLAALANNDLRTDVLKRAFEYLNESSEPVQERVTDALFKRAWEYVLSPYQTQALRAGLALSKVAPKYSAISGYATKVLSHYQPWTKLAAWACVSASGREYFNYNDLLNMLKEISSAEYQHQFRRLLAGGLDLFNPKVELLEIFVLSVAHEILSRGPDAKDLAVLQTVLDQGVGQTTSFNNSIAALLEPHGWQPPKDPLSSLKYLMPSQEFLERWRNEYICILEALDISSAEVNIDEHLADDSVLMHLSGFMDASHHWDVNYYDLWNGDSASEAGTVKEILQAVAAISGIERDRLTSDAHMLLSKLKQETDYDDATSYVHDRLVHVDTSPDWEHAKQLSISLDTLERAMFHRSEWIVMLAANLLGNKASKEQLHPIVERLLDKGVGTTLWATGALARELEPADAAALIRKRLLMPLSTGCNSLFKTLGELSASLDNSETLQALKNGLLCRFPKVAIEAAKVAEKVAESVHADLIDLCWDSYRHWQLNEAPYPLSGGAIPDSPRADLVKAILTFDVVNDSTLISMAADPRPDVREASKQNLLDRLMHSEEFRDKFLSAVLETRLAPKLLAEALKKGTPFSFQQSETIRGLLDDEDPNKRYAAMMALAAPYSTDEESLWRAKKMLGDSETEIRERAHKILRHLEVTNAR